MNTKKKVFDLRFAILVLSQVILALLLIAILFKPEAPDTGKNNAEHWREVASKLHSSGVVGEAARFYELYLKNADVDHVVKATIAYSLGELYEQDQKLEKALAWYYQVEILDPVSKYKPEAGKRIVALLEKLKKFGAARQALKSQTTLRNETQEKAKGAVTVAKIGEREIYLHQIHQAMDTLPQNVRKAFQSKEGQINFLKKYVADELLYDKARRLQYHEKAEFKKQLDQIRKQLLVQKIIEEEVQSKVSLDGVDVKNYFEANRNKYIQKARANVSLIKLKDKSKADAVIKQLESGESFASLAKKESLDADTKDSGGKFEGDVIADQGFLTHTAKTVAEIFATAAGKWTKPLLSQGAFYVFLVRKKFAEKSPKFDEIKKNVEYDYRMEKTQALYQKLIEETLASDKVEIFAEKIN